MYGQLITDQREMDDWIMTWEDFYASNALWDDVLRRWSRADLFDNTIIERQRKDVSERYGETRNHAAR